MTMMVNSKDLVNNEYMLAVAVETSNKNFGKFMTIWQFLLLVIVFWMVRIFTRSLRLIPESCTIDEHVMLRKLAILFLVYMEPFTLYAE
jgi:hypothetical protein